MQSFSRYRVKQSPHSQTLSLVLRGHNQTLSLVLRPHIQTLSLVLGLYNIDLITLWLHESHCQAIDIKEALVGRQPNFIYLIFIFIVILCFIRYMIMRSHEKIKKIKNRVKNRRKKLFTLEAAQTGVQRQ